MKSIHYMIAFIILLAACAPKSSQLIQPTAIVEATITPPAVTPTAEATESSETAISTDEMNTIVAGVNKELSTGFQLKANPDGTYAITGADGKAVQNILLHKDGKFYVTETNGSSTILPPETIFMPTRDTIYAGLDQIDVRTGDVWEIPFEKTFWPADPEHESPRITSDMSSQYDRWMRGQLEKTGKLDLEFQHADTSITWQVVQKKYIKAMDVNADSKPDWMQAPVLYTYVDPRSLIRDRLPQQAFGSFVTLVDKQGVSVFPIFVENADKTQEKYSLFPTLTDTKMINSPVNAHMNSLRTWIDPVVQVLIGNESVDTILFVGPYLDAPSNVDAVGDTSVVPIFLKGTDPTEEAARMSLLQDGIKNGSFFGSEKHWWTIAWFGWAKK